MKIALVGIYQIFFEIFHAFKETVEKIEKKNVLIQTTVLPTRLYVQ